MLTDIFDKDTNLETPCLKLRPITQDDAQDIFEIFSDKQVMKYYDLLPFESLDRAKEQIRFFIDGFSKRQMIRWGIELKESYYKQAVANCREAAGEAIIPDLDGEIPEEKIDDKQVSLF